MTESAPEYVTACGMLHAVPDCWDRWLEEAGVAVLHCRPATWSAAHLGPPQGDGWVLAHERPLREIFDGREMEVSSLSRVLYFTDEIIGDMRTAREILYAGFTNAIREATDA